MALYGDAKREYDKRWMAQRRASFFDGKCCIKCGSIDQLELDHIDPKIKISHRIWSWSKVNQEKELIKCQVLCHVCHQIKSIEESRKSQQYDDDSICRAGHNLAEVGTYKYPKKNNGVHIQCRYCHHIASAIRRGTKIKTINEWISK